MEQLFQKMKTGKHIILGYHTGNISFNSTQIA